MKKYHVILEYTVNISPEYAISLFDSPEAYKKSLQEAIDSRKFMLPPKETKVTVTPGE